MKPFQASTSFPKPAFNLLATAGWKDYELLDSGEGSKLERYGPYLVIRPEHQAFWKRKLSAKRWEEAHAEFVPLKEESGGRWIFKQQVSTPWKMHFKNLNFMAFTSNSRHMGVFPEQASQWDWICERVSQRIANSPSIQPKILNLFGYTGLATLAAAQAGAHVTHVDASKKSILIARENQKISGLGEHPIRWLIDDAFKFVRKEVRRGSTYDGILLDPPKFGRGPQGQVWELFESLPELLENCRALISERPLFIMLTAYAIRASALSIYYAMQDHFQDLGGTIETGELALIEQGSGRLLSTALYSRWSGSN